MSKTFRIKQSDFIASVKNVINENKEVYFSTFSGAVQYARKYVENKGINIDENDWFTEVNVGQGRPKEGKTTKMTLGLFKEDKKLKKTLNIQVYNMGYNNEKPYELNFYVW
jgi:hypothetical protein